MESTEGVEEAESKGEEEDDEDGPTQETEACTTEDEQKDQVILMNCCGCNACEGLYVYVSMFVHHLFFRHMSSGIIIILRT